MATKLDQVWDHLDVGLCDSSCHSAGPNCHHTWPANHTCRADASWTVSRPHFHQDQIYVCESVEAHRTLPARASEQNVLSSDVGFSLKEHSRRSWERCWDPSAYLTKCANSGSKDAFCRAVSSPCVVLRPTLLCCVFSLTIPDTPADRKTHMSSLWEVHVGSWGVAGWRRKMRFPLAPKWVEMKS